METTQLIDALLGELLPEERHEFRRTYERIQQLPASGLQLQPFLDQYLHQAVSLYAATAGVIWLASPGGSLKRNARLGYDRLQLDGELARRHEALVHHALDQPASFLVKPYCAAEPHGNVSNPTDSFVILGPVAAQGHGVAVVELFLGPRPARGRSAGDRQRYVLWLDHLLDFFCRGIERCFLAQQAPLQCALDEIRHVAGEAVELQDQIRLRAQSRLQQFAGWNFGSLRDNQAFAKRVHELLESHGLRVRCPECGWPAILRCQPSRSSKTGVFVFDHYLESGRTFHGGPTTFPSLTLVAKPPRRSRQDR